MIAAAVGRRFVPRPGRGPTSDREREESYRRAALSQRRQGFVEARAGASAKPARLSSEPRELGAACSISTWPRGGVRVIPAVTTKGATGPPAAGGTPRTGPPASPPARR